MQEFKDFITENKTCISQINITLALYKEEHRPLNCCILFKLADCVNDSLHHSFSCWRITPSGSMLERHSSFSLVLHWCMKMIMIQQKYTIYLYTPPKHKNTHRLSLRPVHSIWESCRYVISFSFCSSAVLCCCCFLASVKIPITVARLALSPTESTQSLDIKQTWYTKPIQQLFTRSEGNDVLSTSPTPNSNKYP